MAEQNVGGTHPVLPRDLHQHLQRVAHEYQQSTEPDDPELLRPVMDVLNRQGNVLDETDCRAIKALVGELYDDARDKYYSRASRSNDPIYPSLLALRACYNFEL